MEPKRILHIVGTMDMGGQETFIMNIYRQIDIKKIQFDFVVNSLKKGWYEDEIIKRGGRIYRITPISKNIFKHIKELKDVINKNNYQVIHRHTASSIAFVDILAARICKVKKRIVHAHNTNTDKKLVHFICRPLINMFATKRLACGEQAGRWMFGRKKKFDIIYNAIDLDKFKYNEEKRKKIRKELNISSSTKVIGHIGAFKKQKNHKFIIDVFREYMSEKKDAILLLVGDGELRKEIEKYVEKSNLKDNVKFLGIRNDTSDLFSAFDIFLFPSLFEGLGIVLIEAQISGLKCIVSTKIPEEAIITDNVKKIDLNAKKCCWIKALTNVSKKYNRIIKESEKIKKYDINVLSELIEEIYIS